MCGVIGSGGKCRASDGGVSGGGLLNISKCLFMIRRIHTTGKSSNEKNIWEKGNAYTVPAQYM